jgi:hypothetical protein
MPMRKSMRTLTQEEADGKEGLDSTKPMRKQMQKIDSS